MSTWFKDRRQEFIAATLRQFGQVRRGDLMRQFDISLPQASNDIAAFLANDPPLVIYDTTAKAYVLTAAPKAPPRCKMCDDTGSKDHAFLALDPCDHVAPAGTDDLGADDPLEQVIIEAMASRPGATAYEIAQAIRGSCPDVSISTALPQGAN